MYIVFKINVLLLLLLLVVVVLSFNSLFYHRSVNSFLFYFVFHLMYVCLIDFFENQPNKICSHLSEKASEGQFLKPEKTLQNHSNEGKGKQENIERGDGKEEKRKKQWLHS